MGRKKKTDVTENPLYHDTCKLLYKYRDVVWSLELSVQQVRKQFHIEYGKSIEDFLESVYLAGADLTGTDIEHQARCIQRSAKMIGLVDEAMRLMREKHRDGEELYWILHYTYICRKSVCVPISDGSSMPLKCSVQSCGGILQRTPKKYWMNFAHNSMKTQYIAF